MTGLGTATFQQGIDNIAHAYLIFAQNFAEGQTENWQSNRFRDFAAVDLHARYLTAIRSAPQEENIDYGYMVDPKGVLLGLHGCDYIHGPDNRVEYMELVKSKDGVSR